MSLKMYDIFSKNSLKQKRIYLNTNNYWNAQMTFETLVLTIMHAPLLRSFPSTHTSSHLGSLKNLHLQCTVVYSRIQ